MGSALRCRPAMIYDETRPSSRVARRPPSLDGHSFPPSSQPERATTASADRSLLSYTFPRFSSTCERRSVTWNRSIFPILVERFGGERLARGRRDLVQGLAMLAAGTTAPSPRSRASIWRMPPSITSAFMSPTCSARSDSISEDVWLPRGERGRSRARSSASAMAGSWSRSITASPPGSSIISRSAFRNSTRTR